VGVGFEGFELLVVTIAAGGDRGRLFAERRDTCGDQQEQ
jgi:hypothetical protein